MIDKKEDLKNKLESSGDDYPPISSAPTWQSFVDRMNALKWSDSVLDKEMQREAEKDYKSIDDKGNIYLIKNSALISYQAWKRATTITVAKPKLIQKNGRGGAW